MPPPLSGRSSVSVRPSPRTQANVACGSIRGPGSSRPAARDRLGRICSNELSITGEELDDRRRAGMLDEALEILTAAWWGEPVSHRGGHCTVDDLRFLPRPVQRPGIPVWVGGYPGEREPLRRAVRFQGFCPVDLEHQHRLAQSL